MGKRLTAFRTIIGRAIEKYGKDDPVRLAGTTAYFVIFSIAPILIVITGALGLLVNAETVNERLLAEVEALIGEQGRDFIGNLIANFATTDQSLLGTTVGVAVFLFASTTFFMILQKNLNFIWRVRAKPTHGLLKLLADRLLSFGLILSLGFLLLVSLIIDTLLAFFSDLLERFMDEATVFILEPVNFIVSFGIITVIFALIFKFLPDAQITWRVTWVGALTTAALFTVGKLVIGLALAFTSVDVRYGAAGSVVALLVWVFYSSIILYFGAEITQQYASYHNHEIRPTEHAVQIVIEEVAQG